MVFLTKFRIPRCMMKVFMDGSDGMRVGLVVVGEERRGGVRKE